MKSVKILAVTLILATVAALGWWVAEDMLGKDPEKVRGEDPSTTAVDRSGQNKQSKKSGSLQVEVQPVRRGRIVDSLELSGEVVATNVVVIASIKEGLVTYCPWREGDAVEGPGDDGEGPELGERLVELDREVLRAEVQAQEAALAVARARLADLRAGARSEERARAAAQVRKWQATVLEARTDHKRETQLATEDLTTQELVDRTRTRQEVAQAELATARQALSMLEAGPTATEIAVQESAVAEAAARLALSRAHLSESVLRAPFDGVITAVHVRPGDLAMPRSPLVELYAPDSLVIRCSVPEAQAAGVRPGLRLRATFDALPGRSIDARITRVYPQLDRAMRTRTVEAELTDPAGIVPHMFARLQLVLERTDDAVLVPAAAVLTAPSGERYVFVVDDGKAHRRTITVGIEQDGTVQAQSGLAAGQRLVVAGQAALRDGQSVRVVGSKGAGSGTSSADTPPQSGTSPADAVDER
ncbi:MAG: efflux RND transporter periplasmic adaptor subunit [Planctomycetota bacterium]